MKAKALVKKMGERLVGKKVQTKPMGLWKGGICRVTELRPDPAAPEIVMQVARVADQESIGVFQFEEVQLLEEDTDEE